MAKKRFHRARRAFGKLGGSGGITRTAILGLGAAAVGTYIASKVNLPGGPLVAGGAIGWMVAGPIGAIIGAFGGRLFQTQTAGSGPQGASGQVWM